MKVGYIGIKWESKEQQSKWVAPLRALRKAQWLVVAIAMIGFLVIMGSAILIMNASPSKGVGNQGMVIALPALVIGVSWVVYWINHGESFTFRKMKSKADGSGEVFVGLNTGSESLLIHAPVTEYQDCGWLSFREGLITFRGELYNVEADTRLPCSLSFLNQVFGNQKRTILKFDLPDQSYYFSTPDTEEELLFKKVVFSDPVEGQRFEQNLCPEIASLPAVKPLVLGRKNLVKIGGIALLLMILMQFLTILVLRDRAGVLIGAWTVPSMFFAAGIVLRRQIEFTTFGEASVVAKQQGGGRDALSSENKGHAI